MPIVISEEVLRSAHVNEDEARLAMALRLFEDDRLTLAQSARLAGLPLTKFQQELGKRGIPVHYGTEQIDADLRYVAELDEPVFDTSPILNLAVIGQVELLRQMYGEMVMPPAVARELLDDGFDPGAVPWLVVRSARNRTQIFKEGRTFVAHTRELDLSSCGGSQQKALENLTEAVRLFLDEANKMGTLEQILEEAGYH